MTIMTQETFNTALNLLRLRFQDIHRDLTEVTQNAVSADLIQGGEALQYGVEDESINAIYNLITAIDIAGGGSGEGWSDIQEVWGLASLVKEESNQVEEKILELAYQVNMREELALGLVAGIGVEEFTDLIISITENLDLSNIVDDHTEAGFQHPTDTSLNRTYTDYTLYNIELMADGRHIYTFYFTFNEPVSDIEGKFEVFIL